MSQEAWNKGQHKIKSLFDIYYCTVCGKPLISRQVSVLLCKNKWDGKHPDTWGCSSECGQIIATKKRIGHPISEETRKKIGDSQRGSKNHAYGKPSWNKGIPMSKDTKNKLKKNAWRRSGKEHPMYGKKHKPESIAKMKEARKYQVISNVARRKLRIARIENMKKNGFRMPAYNSKASAFFKILDENIEGDGWFALNGKLGEYYIKELGYWPDYISFKRKLICEFYELHHFNEDGSLKTKDLLREKEIKEHYPDFQFIAIKESQLYKDYWKSSWICEKSLYEIKRKSIPLGN